MAGWVKLFIAVPVIVCLLFCLLRLILKAPDLFELHIAKKEVKTLLFIAFIIFLWVAMSGIGGQAYQNDDHRSRNGAFNLLVENSWPVVGSVPYEGVVVERGVSYYIGFWLPSAVIGKLFGLRIGYLFQIVWAVLGVFLFYFGICILLKRIKIWPLFVVIFFSGMDIIGTWLSGGDMQSISQSTHLEWWCNGIAQYSSMTTQLFWVFNQSIPAWLIVVLLLLLKDNRYMVLILSTAVLSCTMPFVGLLPYCAYWAFSRDYLVKRFSKEWWKHWYKDTFTIENILGGGIMGIISYFFVSNSGNNSNTGLHLLSFRNGGWLVWLTFIAVEIGGIIYISRNNTKEKPLLYISTGILLILPLIRNFGNDRSDLTMRASIPALLVLCVMVISSLSESLAKKSYYKFAIFVTILAIGAVTPVHEMIRTISITKERYVSEEYISVKMPASSAEGKLKSIYWSADTDTNLFYKYLAK
jgi:hypothetical protein